MVIGNEILSGKVQDANTHTLARALRPLGIELRRVVVVPDEIDLIAGEVNALRCTHDHLFTSGGVGPTHDDLTVAAVARAFGRAVVRDPSLEALLRGHYGERCTEGHLRMADVVEGTELHPGLDARWPTMVLGNVYVLPGVPQIFEHKLRGLLEKLRGPDAPFVLRRVYCSGDEGEIKVYIDDAVARFPDVSIGSYPRWDDPDHRVQITFDGTDAARVDAAQQAFIAALPPEYFLRAG